MTSKFPLLWRSLIVLLVLLASCTTVPAEPAATETLTAVNVPSTETLSPLPTPTPYPLGSPIPFPTQPNLPLSTTSPTQTPLPAVLPKFPLDGYVVLFSKDGDLYFQDGETLPVQLTNFEDKSDHPSYITLLSDDNQKVVIIRKDDSNVYSISTDGTQEQTIISNDKMSSFGSNMKIGALKFVPHTHQLFFIAIQCEAQDGSLCPTSAFLANVDTGKITKLADLGSLLINPDFGEAGLGSLFVNPYNGEYRNIKISPDGKMLAVGTPDGMDIFTLDGNLIRDNVLPFTPSTENTVYQSLFWLPDSSGLIVALPDTLVQVGIWGNTAAYTIWRYTLNYNSTVQMPFNPPIVGRFFEVSPNGNWIVYYGGLPESPYYLYLGNLATGNVNSFGNQMGQIGISWSPDSKYFIFSNGAIASLDGLLVFQGSADLWIDSNHFISSAPNPDFTLGEYVHYPSLIAEIRGGEIYQYESEFSYPRFHFWLIKPKR